MPAGTLATAAAIAITAASNTVYNSPSGELSPSSQVSYVKFTLPEPEDFAVLVDNTTANVDAYLLDASGNQVVFGSTTAKSENPGTAPELIDVKALGANTSLKAGLYYLKLVLKDTSSTTSFRVTVRRDANANIGAVWQDVGTTNYNIAYWTIDPSSTVIDTGLTGSSNPGSDWVPVATADFNNDGYRDIAWYQASTGATGIWLMGASKSLVSTVSTATLPSGWVLDDAVDINSDGNVDFIIRDSTYGYITAWLMNSSYSTTSSVSISTSNLGNTWYVAGHGDFNGDLKPDLFFENYGSAGTTGNIGVWYMNGTTVSSTTALPVLAANGDVVRGLEDVNGDDYLDALVYNPSTGNVYIAYYYNSYNSIYLGSSLTNVGSTWRQVFPWDAPSSGLGYTDLIGSLSVTLPTSITNTVYKDAVGSAYSYGQTDSSDSYVVTSPTGKQVFTISGATSSLSWVVKDASNTTLQSGTGNKAATTITNSGALTYTFTSSSGTQPYTFAVNSGINLAAITPSSAGSIYTGNGGSMPSNYVSLGSYSYFLATDCDNGTLLYKSDGTSSGTTAVTLPSGLSNPSQLTVMGSYIYLTLTGSTYGTELYKYDGSTTFTLVKDINTGTSGAASSNPSNLTAIGSTLYFSADDGSHGVELWKSDGTSTNTILVSDIDSGTTSSIPNSSYPYGFTALGSSGAIIFGATDVTNGTEPRYYSGSGSTVSLVNDINSGSSSSSPDNFTAFSSKVYFSATGSNGNELYYTSNGSSVTGININSGSADSNPSDFAVLQSSSADYELDFAATDSTNGREFRQVLASAPSTVTTFDLNPGSGDSNPNNLTASPNKDWVVFTASGRDAGLSGNPLSGNEMWFHFAGSSTPSVLVDINSGTGDSNPYGYTWYDNNLFYFGAAANGTDTELFAYQNGNTTVAKLDINSGSSGSYPYIGGFIPSTRKLMVAAFTGDYGIEPYTFTGQSTDGNSSTLSSSNLVLDKDISNCDVGGGGQFVVMGGSTYFVGPSTSGNVLYRTSGSTTTALTPASGSPTIYDPSYLTVVGSNLYMIAYIDTKGYELVKATASSGSTMTYTELTDSVLETGADSSSINNLEAYAPTSGTSYLYFSAYKSSSGTGQGESLWKTDGSTVSLVKNFTTSSDYPTRQVLTYPEYTTDGSSGAVFTIGYDTDTQDYQIWETNSSGTNRLYYGSSNYDYKSALPYSYAGQTIPNKSDGTASISPSDSSATPSTNGTPLTLGKLIFTDVPSPNGGGVYQYFNINSPQLMVNGHMMIWSSSAGRFSNSYGEYFIDNNQSDLDLTLLPSGNVSTFFFNDYVVYKHAIYGAGLTYEDPVSGGGNYYTGTWGGWQKLIGWEPMGWHLARYYGAYQYSGDATCSVQPVLLNNPATARTNGSIFGDLQHSRGRCYAWIRPGLAGGPDRQTQYIADETAFNYVASSEHPSNINRTGTTVLTTSNLAFNEYDNGSGANSFVSLDNGIILFIADDGTHGFEPYAIQDQQTDNLATSNYNVQLLADLVSGSDSSNPRNIVAANGLGYFVATTATYGTQIYVTDGYGVQKLTSFTSNEILQSLESVNNVAYYTYFDKTARTVYVKLLT